MSVKSIKDYPDILNIQEVMEILRVGRVTVYHYIHENVLPARKMAGKYRIPKSGIIDILEEIEKDRYYLNHGEDSHAHLERSVI